MDCDINEEERDHGDLNDGEGGERRHREKV